MRCARNIKVRSIRSITSSLSNGVPTQVVHEDKERFGEVYFFYRIGTEGDQRRPVALISLYSTPDPDLLEVSSGTLLVCRYFGDGSLILVEAQAIKSVIATVPFIEKSEGGRPRCHRGRFFVDEKPGLSLAELGMEEGLEVFQD